MFLPGCFPEHLVLVASDIGTGPSSTKSKISDISILRFSSAKSRATNRRTYSANEMPRAAALAPARHRISGSILI
jgi:hypothetical protein